MGELSAITIVLGLLSFVGLIGGFWLFTTYLGQAVASLAIGRLVTGSLGARQIAVAFLAGLVIFALACSVPYVGGMIAFAGMLLALGGLALWLISGRAPETTAAVPAKAVPAP